MRVFRYAAGRIGQYVLVVAFLVTLNFTLPRALPGGPLQAIAGSGNVGELTPAQRQHLLAQYGLNRALPLQFLRYLNDLVHFRLGRSFQTGQSVGGLILGRLPWTLLLVGSAIVVSTVVGVLVGVWAASRRRRGGDTAGLVGILVLDALPPFWVGLMLILVFGVKWHLLPIFGATSLLPSATTIGSVTDVARHLVLPLSTLVVADLGQNYLVARYTMLSVLDQDFMVLARAKGLPPRRLTFHHAMRNAILPVQTHFFIEVGWLFGGALIVETVFGYPGLGRLMFDAIGERDYPVLQGAFLIVGFAVVAVNLLADVIYPFIDPRVRRPLGAVAPA